MKKKKKPQRSQSLANPISKGYSSDLEKEQKKKNKHKTQKQGPTHVPSISLSIKIQILRGKLAVQKKNTMRNANHN